MLINVVEGEEVRIAVVQDGRLEELYMERASAESHVGNIYKGRVVNVEPSIQAAFIDFGQAKNGFLHISDLQPQYFPGSRQGEEVGKKTSRRDRPPIQKCLNRGQEVIVQVTKEGIGTKGPTLTTYVSIPGRFLVLMPGMSRLGVSRKIEDEDARRQIRSVLDELNPPKDMGFIVRTAGIGRNKRDLQRDLNYLLRLWKTVADRIKNEKAPAELYQESDLIMRTIRDVFNSDIARFIVDNEAVCNRVREFLNIALPRASKQLVQLYADPAPLFHRYGIEQELERTNSRHVPLPSGGSLVIDQTEALVAIDVNSGRYRAASDAEKTAFRTDVEAAGEIARQLRLRDLGGLIIMDFIDLRDPAHQREVERTLRDAMKNDRARSEMLKMSRFGIVEMTRQRMRPSLERSLYADCPHCRGSGLVKTAESLCFDVMRTIQAALSRPEVDRVEVTVCPAVCQYLNNRKRRSLVQMEELTGKRVVVNLDENLGADEVRYQCSDKRGSIIATDLTAKPTDGRGGPRQGQGVPKAAPSDRREHAHELPELREDFEDLETEADLAQGPAADTAGPVPEAGPMDDAVDAEEDQPAFADEPIAPPPERFPEPTRSPRPAPPVQQQQQRQRPPSRGPAGSATGAPPAPAGEPGSAGEPGPHRRRRRRRGGRGRGRGRGGAGGAGGQGSQGGEGNMGSADSQGHGDSNPQAGPEDQAAGPGQPQSAPSANERTASDSVEDDRRAQALRGDQPEPESLPSDLFSDDLPPGDDGID